ncbi:Gfo/Idh/MocA family oxidoreductase [Saxibacter everestensis]|uniref:Gfo/Idh/MocA family oxidoreductase n=1 Tax=Saxibacter everestensis TaxID=2909229 RepID=A0ABY8QV26_9MICO|nr:Gfo/Idh/MocA family oxidoreductase [Brevibacteriaceae bacterium ZFBP1038]
MKLVQVGLGAWGASWLSVVDRSPRWDLAGLVDIDSEAARAAGERYGVPSGTRLADALAEDVDAVLVIVPPEFHADVAVEAMAAGKHVLIEKPLAHSYPDGLRIVEAARTSGVTAMVSQNYRFSRAARTVQRLVREDVIGRVRQVFIDYHKNPPFEGFRLVMDEPLIVDAMVHHLDQMRGILGIEPALVRARSWNPAWSRFTGNSSAVVDVRTADGATIAYSGSWSSLGPQTSWDGDWNIQGDKGAIIWRNNSIEIHFASLFDTVFLPGAREESGVLHVDLDVVEAEDRPGTLAAFADSIVDGTAPETDVEDNLKSLSLVQATVESARNHGAAAQPKYTEAKAGVPS